MRQPKKIAHSDVIALIKEHDLVPPKFVVPVVDTFMQILKQKILEGYAIDLGGFCSIFARQLPARNIHAWNSSDKFAHKVSEIPPRHVLKLNTYQSFREVLRDAKINEGD